MQPPGSPAPQPSEPGPPHGPDLHGWIRLEPILVTRLDDRLLIDAVLIDAVFLDGRSGPRGVHRTAGEPADSGRATPPCGLAASLTASRGTPLTLSLSLGAGGFSVTPDRSGEGEPVDVDELTEALRDAEAVHLFRDDDGTALILRRGAAWWYLEVGHPG